jgi:hypothetical protein
LQSPTGGLFGPKAQLNKWEKQEKEREGGGEKVQEERERALVGIWPN